jgi:hypothetical protein
MRILILWCCLVGTAHAQTMPLPRCWPCQDRVVQTPAGDH